MQNLYTSWVVGSIWLPNHQLDFPCRDICKADVLQSCSVVPQALKVSISVHFKIATAVCFIACRHVPCDVYVIEAPQGPAGNGVTYPGPRTFFLIQSEVFRRRNRGTIYRYAVC
jgi:hypothetical protein